MKKITGLVLLIAALVLILSASSLAEVSVGSKLTFGSYEQDCIRENGTEPIEWKVLTVKNGRALLVTDKVIDWYYFNAGNTQVTWGQSSICLYLNGDFFYSAFTAEERAAIVPNVDADGKHVFLLSENEMRTFFSGANERVAYPTSYALSLGAWTWSDTNGTTFWLRDTVRPNGNQFTLAKLVTGNGIFDLNGQTQHSNRRGIRPAVWVDLSRMN